MQEAVAADAQEEKARWIQAHRSYKAGVAALAATTQLTHDFIEAVIKDSNAWVVMGQNGTVQKIHKGQLQTCGAEENTYGAAVQCSSAMQYVPVRRGCIHQVYLCGQ